MARASELAKNAKAAIVPEEKLLAVFERDMAKYPADKQERKWDALEKFVKDHAPAVGVRATR